MKKKFLAGIILLTIAKGAFAVPLAGVSGISGNTDRAAAFARIFEQRILEILGKNGFNIIKPEIINRELRKFNCTEEMCILNFASSADISLIVSGRVLDKGSSMQIKLDAFGIDFPFNGRLINSYEIEIPLDVEINAREFSLIGEEHSAEFLVKTLSLFRYPVKVRMSGDKPVIAGDQDLKGEYTVYFYGEGGKVAEGGTVSVSSGDVVLKKGTLTENSFILKTFKGKSIETKKYYSSRKREIVFQKTSFYDTLFLVSVTPFASASMPVSSPFLGYYMNSDWSGLGLWMVNTPLYLYVEARGFLNSPSRLKEKHEDISRDDRAMNYFAWYMLCAGGMPLFIDSYAHSYLYRASFFTGENALLGNSATAAILSLTGNGSGHFYRGERFWGYFYFHLNNALLYMTLREWSRPEKYDKGTGTYIKGDRNSNKAAKYLSVLAVSKTVEIIHAALSSENINSGTDRREYIIPEPLFTLDGKGDPYYGINFSLKF